MELTIVGYRPYDFTDKDGLQHSGVTFHYVTPFTVKNAGGFQCDKFSLSEKEPCLKSLIAECDSAFKKGDNVVVTAYFNRYGRVCDIRL